MRLTIIIAGGEVYKDGVCYAGLTWAGTPNDVHALQWFDTEGWIEYVGNVKPNETITALPSWTNNALDAWQAAYDAAQAPLPPPTAESNKIMASTLLYETDWTTIPDVADPTKSNPYLVNVSEFLAYRNAVRQYAINPVAGNINWPSRPDAVWSSS